jgi:uncharacterized protein YuzE
MKVHYDEEIDALYLQLSDIVPDGAVELAEGINIDTNEKGNLSGIEILDASKFKRIDIDTILSKSME